MPEQQHQNENRQTLFKYLAWGFGSILVFLIIDRSLNWNFVNNVWPLALVVLILLSSWFTWNYWNGKSKKINEMLVSVAKVLESWGYRHVHPRNFEYEELDEDELAVYIPNHAKLVVWSIRKQAIIRRRTMTLHQYKEEYSKSKLEDIRRRDAEASRGEEEESGS